MAISLKLAAPPSDEEILELSQRNPGYEFERTAAGELVVTPTGSAGGRRDAVLVRQLDTWAEADSTGVAFGSSTGFHLPDGSLLVPDASWVRGVRWEALSAKEQEEFAPLCPDAVFEILSAADALSNLRKKMRAYLKNGAQLAVLIDPQRRTAEVYAPGRETQIMDSPQSVSFEPVLPRFTLNLGRIFS